MKEEKEEQQQQQQKITVDGRGREEKAVIKFIIIIFVITKSKLCTVAPTYKPRSQEDLATEQL